MIEETDTTNPFRSLSELEEQLREKLALDYGHEGTKTRRTAPKV